eukprot:TRINITY_DN18080_c0_g1_i1.p1 TRINITY_DN18080_c0_g1~~TRINITY_DN18080_c0_g1_i1.p1  ORF type:complete len:349 (-),score=80.08 TRINITY_DN18080_c0_g1_i1:132-1178(-)
MAECQGIAMTVLWLPLEAPTPQRRPLLCVQCIDADHFIWKSALNLAQEEGVPSKQIANEEALRSQEDSTWHVEWYSSIEHDGIRAVGIAGKKKDRLRANMLSIALSLRIRRQGPGLYERNYDQQLSEALRRLEAQVVDLMRGEPPPVRSATSERQPRPAAADASSSAPAAAATSSSSSSSTSPFKAAPPANCRAHFPWAPPGAGFEHWGPRIVSPGGPPPNRLLPPPPPPRPAPGPAATPEQVPPADECSAQVPSLHRCGAAPELQPPPMPKSSFVSQTEPVPPLPAISFKAPPPNILDRVEAPGAHRQAAVAAAQQPAADSGASLAEDWLDGGRATEPVKQQETFDV